MTQKNCFWNPDTLEYYRELKNQTTQELFIKDLWFFIYSCPYPDDGLTYDDLFNDLLNQINTL